MLVDETAQLRPLTAHLREPPGAKKLTFRRIIFRPFQLINIKARASKRQKKIVHIYEWGFDLEILKDV